MIRPPLTLSGFGRIEGKDEGGTEVPKDDFAEWFAEKYNDSNTMTAPRTTGMGGHQSANMGKDEWLTPPELIEMFGPFDLDPCSSGSRRPWDTAKNHFSLTDTQDGLAMKWYGRVWLNPPYGREAGAWLEKLADHGDGIALIFARTETDMFFKQVWDKADALLFIRGRLHFYHVDGKRAEANAGAPSVLIAYGQNNVETLERERHLGHLVYLSKGIGTNESA